MYDSPLIVTSIEKEAEYVKIVKKLFPLAVCDVREGEIYPIRRKYYSNNEKDFMNGEAYVINDAGKECFGIFMICKTEMYKTK